MSSLLRRVAAVAARTAVRAPFPVVPRERQLTALTLFVPYTSVPPSETALVVSLVS